jgi:hypothetical protein
MRQGAGEGIDSLRAVRRAGAREQGSQRGCAAFADQIARGVGRGQTEGKQNIEIVHGAIVGYRAVPRIVR